MAANGRDFHSIQTVVFKYRLLLENLRYLNALIQFKGLIFVQLLLLLIFFPSKLISVEMYVLFFPPFSPTYVFINYF